MAFAFIRGPVFAGNWRSYCIELLPLPPSLFDGHVFSCTTGSIESFVYVTSSFLSPFFLPSDRQPFSTVNQTSCKEVKSFLCSLNPSSNLCFRLGYLCSFLPLNTAHTMVTVAVTGRWLMLLACFIGNWASSFISSLMLYALLGFI